MGVGGLAEFLCHRGVVFCRRTGGKHFFLVFVASGWFEGYGCTANQGETLEMRDFANELGHEIAKDSTSAKTVVLGTCTVIESTQNKMEKRISEPMDQGKNVIVSGCMATADTKVLNSKFPNAPLVSPGDINGLGDLIG